MNQSRSKKSPWYLIIPPIVIGIAVFMMMKSGKTPPQLTNSEPAPTPVRVMTVEQKDFTPVIHGYGIVQPAQVWKSIAQVSGRIINTHPRLNNGEIIQKGELLYRVDPVDYELNLVQAQTQLSELELQLKNTEASLQIEQRNLALAEKEYRRLEGLANKGDISQSSADSSERTMLSSRAQVQNLKNTLSLIPTQQKLQRAKIIQAQRDLDNTEVLAPFNLRIASLDIEQDQYVSKGQLLFIGDAIDRVEITAQFAPSEIKNLFQGQQNVDVNLGSLSQNLHQLTGFKPEISLDLGNPEPARWQAEFVRFSDAVDSQTRTIGIVIAVDKPLQQVIPGIKPPLSKGMLVDVSIAGKIQPDTISIPRSALRNRQVYLMTDDQRLQTRTVAIKYHQQQFTVIDSGLSAGDVLVLTDLIPAAPGMPLKPVMQAINGAQ